MYIDIHRRKSEKLGQDFDFVVMGLRLTLLQSYVHQPLNHNLVAVVVTGQYQSENRLKSNSSCNPPPRFGVPLHPCLLFFFNLVYTFFMELSLSLWRGCPSYLPQDSKEGESSDAVVGGTTQCSSSPKAFCPRRGLIMSEGKYSH